jgi:uncharacterized protein YqhQ
MYSNKQSLLATSLGVVAIGVVGFLYGIPWIGVVFCAGGLLLLVLGATLK